MQLNEDVKAGFFVGAAAWARDRWWQWRVPLLGYLAWDARVHLRDADARGLFGGITFGVHEFGHLLFAFFGEFMTVAGGSLTQLLIPLATALLLYRHRDYFGIAVAGAWLASSLFDLAVYIGDARSFDLDLVSFGENAVHDWAWLLGHLHLLGYDHRIAAVTRGTGVLVLLASLLFGAWLCFQMGGRKENPAPS
ncbi:MAG: hypothetical protein ABI587_10915 [Gemmatimonadales bacterium]